jgi:hypothetical protein
VNHFHGSREPTQASTRLGPRILKLLPLIAALLPIFFVIVALLGTTEAAQIPNVALEVTVRQKEEGKVQRGLHLLHLSCWDGACQFITLTLNQCFHESFYPKIETASTADGTLSVTESDGVLHLRQTGLDFTAHYRFGYSKEVPGVPIATRVTSFSGGYTKNSTILRRVFTAEYVPLQGSYTHVRLDCQASLPGVDSDAD